MTCLPWWHTKFAALSGSERIRSGCPLVGGNIQCAPEAMRKAAETTMRKLGFGVSISLPEYTLSRYISSEVGSGTPEEKVAVAEAARNKSEGNVNALLLYRQPTGHANRGYYGPIHGSGGTSTAPYGRWASTKADPKIIDILIAKFVLAGKSKNFAHGADDQIGMELLDNPRGSVLSNARRRNYWVGPLPGVDHWHTFLYAHRPNISPDSPEGRSLVAQALTAVASRKRPDWSGLRVCRKPSTIWGSLLVGVSVSAAIYFFGRRRWWG